MAERDRGGNLPLNSQTRHRRAFRQRRRRHGHGHGRPGGLGFLALRALGTPCLAATHREPPQARGSAAGTWVRHYLASTRGAIGLFRRAAPFQKKMGAVRGGGGGGGGARATNVCLLLAGNERVFIVCRQREGVCVCVCVDCLLDSHMSLLLVLLDSHMLWIFAEASTGTRSSHSLLPL